MFYQVKVANADCTYRRFLWWPDSNLQSELEEYEMVLHLLGAAFSPSCSNFALCKTAEHNSDHFPEEVVSKVKKNIHAYDCLKSLPSTEEACDLPSLLSRGVFRPIKWIDNDRRNYTCG